MDRLFFKRSEVLTRILAANMVFLALLVIVAFVLPLSTASKSKSVRQR